MNSNRSNVVIITIGILVLVSFLLLGVGQGASGSDADSESLSTLDFKVEGTHEGDSAVYRYRGKNIETEEEAVRIDITKEGGSEFIIILDKGENKVWMKEFDKNNWRTLPGMFLSQMWQTWRNPYFSLLDTKSAAWEEMEGEVYHASSEEGKAKIYDIVVNEPIEDSVFQPE